MYKICAACNKCKKIPTFYKPSADVVNGPYFNWPWARKSIQREVSRVWLWKLKLSRTQCSTSETVSWTFLPWDVHLLSAISNVYLRVQKGP